MTLAAWLMLVREMYRQPVTHEFSGGDSATLDWKATRTERATMLSE